MKLNPYKKSIIYPKFTRVGRSSRKRRPLKKINNFLYWYAYLPFGFKGYKKKSIDFAKRYVDLKETENNYIYCRSKQDGSCIGELSSVIKFLNYWGIKEFYKIREQSKVASIGFNPDKKIWYGWSYRAIYGFYVGQKIEYREDLLILKDGWLKGCEQYEEEQEDIQRVEDMFKNGVLTVESLNQAMFLAKRFADSIA